MTVFISASRAELQRIATEISAKWGFTEKEDSLSLVAQDNTGTHVSLIFTNEDMERPEVEGIIIVDNYQTGVI